MTLRPTLTYGLPFRGSAGNQTVAAALKLYDRSVRQVEKKLLVTPKVGNAESGYDGSSSAIDWMPRVFIYTAWTLV